MSAFLVSNETICKVCSAFTYDKPYGLGDLDELGRALLRMNHEALLERYDDPVPKSIGFTFDIVGGSRPELKKACHCLRYQCSEGNVPNCELYRKLESIIELFSDVSRESEEYENAAWD